MGLESPPTGTLGQVRALIDDDIWLLSQGTHERLYEVLGSHPGGDGSVTFRVWAPNASAVAVVGDFCDWDPTAVPMADAGGGVWEAQTEAGQGDAYKYLIRSKFGGYTVQKADPFAFHAETPPATASKVWSFDHEWGDAEWMSSRRDRSAHDAPISIYEMHLGSWRRDGWVTYRSLADALCDHLERSGFTHVEMLPVMEHPYYGSWGYQVTGFFAPTSRYGPPEDLMYLIDRLHQRGLGVIFDWVPSHFPTDEHGLGYFDGTHLYESADPRRGFHPDWSSWVFNYDRPEVRSFLLSSAHWWCDRFHGDGIRVDAVASMLHLDYSRKEGEWVPNQYGGRENLGAVDFLKNLNTSLYGRFPDIQTYAEESTAWPLVTRPVSVGGLGFGYKWDMGWMNDTLEYVRIDPFFRSHADNHRRLTFRQLYAGAENYVLALSHDEVVHGKRSLAMKPFGDTANKLATLRALLGYQWALPGKKLVFMGTEIAQRREWNHEAGLDWSILDEPGHSGVLAWVGALNRLLRANPSLYAADYAPEGFRWVDADDRSRSLLSFLRLAAGNDPVLVVVNFSPQLWRDVTLGVPAAGRWEVVLSSDAGEFGGSDHPEATLAADADPSAPLHGMDQSVTMTVPPLAVLFAKPGSE